MVSLIRRNAPGERNTRRRPTSSSWRWRQAVRGPRSGRGRDQVMARIYDASTGGCRLVDDLDFTEAEQTFHYRLDGVYYEIALSAGNLERLRDCLAPYIAASHIVGRASR